MAFIIGLYLVIDVWQHKGQTRILFPGAFPEHKVESPPPAAGINFINTGKEWKKGINTREQLNALDKTVPGFEVDLYFDTAKHIFDVHHDAGKSTGFRLDELLVIYRQKKLDAAIWLDIKNLDQRNSPAALISLIRVRDQYALQNRLIVESSRAELLTAFTDSLFFTSFYVPMFNPYSFDDEETRAWVDKLATSLKSCRVNALSGYYFQYSFLLHYFPRYPILTWADNNSFSLVNLLFRKKIEADKAVFIILYP